MRYYRIDITDPSTGKPIYLKSLNGQPLTSLLPNGVTNPGALNVELDCPVYPYSTGDATNTYVKIYGIGLQDIGASFNLNGVINVPASGLVSKTIVIRGGMAAGLPLANPKQQGVLLQGSIFQSFGNWRGTEMSLVLVVGPAVGTQDSPTPISFVWPKGVPLSGPLGNALSAALPGLKQRIAISPNLVVPETETCYYLNLRQFATWLKQATQPILGGTYNGVDIDVQNNVVSAYDGMVAPQGKTPTQIAPQDLIGQPTWHQANVITFQTVMRGDIHLQDIIELPPTIISQTQASMLRFQDRSSFSGKYTVMKMHYWGNFRQPDAASWNTTFWVAPAPKQAS